MPLWAKVDVDMPTDGKLFGQPVSTRFLWLCLICLAKKQDAHGEIEGFDCALLASAFNLSRKAVADALTHYQAASMVELEVDGTIRLLNFDKRQGSDDTTTDRSARYYESHRETVLAKRKVSRASSHAVSRENAVRTPLEVSRKTVSLEQSREEQNRAEDQKPSPQAATPPGYPALIAHFSETLQRIASLDYKFQPEHGKHVKTLLRDYGLDEAKRLVDLAAERYSRDRFWRDKGFTLRRIATDAEALSTARPKPQPVRDLDREDLKTFAAAHPEYAEDEVLDRWHEQRRAAP